MKKYLIEFEENGGEYIGSLEITAKYASKFSSDTILADGVEIKIDEKITSIQEIK